MNRKSQVVSSAFILLTTGVIAVASFGYFFWNLYHVGFKDFYPLIPIAYLGIQAFATLCLTFSITGGVDNVEIRTYILCSVFAFVACIIGIFMIAPIRPMIFSDLALALVCAIFLPVLALVRSHTIDLEPVEVKD